MNNLISLFDKINFLQQEANKQKGLSIHKDNIFNKEVGKILSELRSLEIILSRINNEASNDSKTSKLKLDIKSLYIFGFIFIESVIYFLRIFFPKTKDIEFESIGKFLKSVEIHRKGQEGRFGDFLDKKLTNIQKLNDSLREFRGLISHEKRSTTEWTFTDPRNPMSGSKIVNVSWPEDEERWEKSSLSPSQFTDLTIEEIGGIFDYFKDLIDVDKEEIDIPEPQRKVE